MSTETTAPRRGRPPRNQPDEVSLDTIPPHPPITGDGLRDADLKQWFVDYYPSLAAYLYTGRIINPK